MSRFNVNEADNYGQAGRGTFFSLRDDKDTAHVRMLYRSIDDVEGYAVHQIETADGKKRYVNCLRNYNDPIDKCPFCAANMKVIPKLFIKLYNEDAQECQVWERGKSFFQRISSLSSRYNPLCNEVIEVERNGKKGDMKTTYEFYPLENSPIDLDDEKYDCPEPLGTIILDKTADEMNKYLEVGDFPSDSAKVSNTRTNGRFESPDSSTPFDENRPVGRRTPNNTGRRAF